MGAREHKGGVEVVQELHVVSSVLGRTPFVGLWRTPLLPPLLLPPRTAALVWGRGSRQEFAPRSATRGLVCLTLTRVEAVLKACSTLSGPTSASPCSSATKAFEAALKGSQSVRRPPQEEQCP
jgi:hypothetical protein